MGELVIGNFDEVLILNDRDWHWRCG